jgi:hypothetical protein
MMKRPVFDQRRGRALALAVLVAATLAACAQMPSDPSSGSSVPGSAPIDYHGFPYNIQAG